MSALRALVHLARADFLERVRRYSFFVLVVATVYLGYLFVPPADAAYQTVALGDARGVYNSPWVGAMFGLMVSTLVTLIAFYPIKNTVARDRQTQVGQVIAATPMRKPVYVLGKWLSNLTLLTLLLCVMTGMAVVMQWVRAEDTHVDLVALAIPLWLIALPALSLVAALAVLYECVPFLRGGLGNVLYFFLYMAVLTVWIAGADGVVMEEVNDPFGIAHVIADMQRVLRTHNPAYAGQVTIGGAALSAEPLIFRWEGLRWSGEMIWQRLSWVGVAALLAMAAAVPFDRFDPARSRRRRSAVRDDAPGEVAHGGEGDVERDPTAETRGATRLASTLTPLAARRPRSRFAGVLLAELRLMLRGYRLWGYVVIVGLNVAVLAVPDATVRRYLQAAAWLWPILLWSSMGGRERRRNTGQIVFSVAHPLGRQLVGTWLAGVCVAVLASAGFAARSLFAGQWGVLGGWAAGVVFVPSLALALGTWSGSSRAFEVVYTFLWYVGPMNGVAALDYAATTTEAVTSGVPLWYALAAVVLFVLAVLGRQRELRR